MMRNIHSLFLPIFVTTEDNSVSVHCMTDYANGT